MDRYTHQIITTALIELELIGEGAISREARGEIIEFGVRFKSSNFAGRPVGSVETTRYHRAAVRAERLGLLRRVAALGNRTTNFMLTRRGIAAAIDAAEGEGGHPNLNAINRAVDQVCDGWKIEHPPKEGTHHDRSTKENKPTRPASRTGTGQRRRNRRAA